LLRKKEIEGTIPAWEGLCGVKLGGTGNWKRGNKVFWKTTTRRKNCRRRNKKSRKETVEKAKEETSEEGKFGDPLTLGEGGETSG